MKKTIKWILITLSFTAAASVMAEDLAVPVGQQGAQNMDRPRPKTGMSMDQVSSRYGSPLQRISAVGEPPISRWVYDTYTVYFENNHVIHSVLHASR